MSYDVRLSARAERALLDLTDRDARRVAAALRLLGMEPRQPGTIKLTGVPFAQYRHRIGDYRILFDIDDAQRVVRVYDIRRRGERTYR